jgi:hypothetical protein
MEALERLLPWQAGVIPMEGLAAEKMEVVPVIVADVERDQTLLFLRASDSTDMLFALETSKDSKEDSESSSGNSWGYGRGCDDRVSIGHFSFLPCLPLLFACPLLFHINYILCFASRILFLCVRCLLAKRHMSSGEENDKVKNKNQKEGDGSECFMALKPTEVLHKSCGLVL